MFDFSKPRMSLATQTLDALWHCFCPRFSTKIFNTALCFATKTRPISCPIVKRSSQSCCLGACQYHASRSLENISQLHKCKNGSYKAYDTSIKSNSSFYGELHKASTKGDMLRVQEQVRHLVEERAELPNSRMYTALLLANTDPQYGSPVEAERLLHEMEDAEILPASIHYHAVLKVLSIHPDYLFRNEILDKMQQKWFSLTLDGWHDVVVGLLRERQIERAIDKLDQMQKEGLEIRAWLHDMLVYILCDIEEFEQVLIIMRERFNKGELEISGTLWAHILDTASRALCYELTLYAWRSRVANEYLSPSSGVCINVLDVAARQGDYRLATDVFRILGKRSSNLKLYHYEALLQSYIKAGDLSTSLTILTIMLAAGIQPEEGTTRPIYLYLCKSLSHTREAFSIIQKLHDGQRQIPTTAINCIIEAAVQHGDLNYALEIYQTLNTLCSAGPTTATFNALFRGCAHSCQKSPAMFLACEMLALKLTPNALTYDRLMLVCLACKDVEDAFRYYGEMKSMGWFPRRGTITTLVKQTCELGDERVFDILDEIEKNGMDVFGLQRWVGEKWDDEVTAKNARWIHGET